MTGHVAAQYAGPAVTLSIVLAGLTCAFAGLCYAEFASLIPIAGSAYTYAYSTLGEIFAWIIGWDLILEYSVGATTVAIGWSGYVVSFLKGIGIDCPRRPGRRALRLRSADRRLDENGRFHQPSRPLDHRSHHLRPRPGHPESATVNSIIVFLKISIISSSSGPGCSSSSRTSGSPSFPRTRDNPASSAGAGSFAAPG